MSRVSRILLPAFLVVLVACDSGTTDTRPSALPAGNRTVTGPPGASRIYPLVVASGDSVVVVGGAQPREVSPGAHVAGLPLGGGAVLGPDGDWRKLTGSAKALAPIVRAGGVATDGDVLVLGTPCAEPPPPEDSDRWCPEQSLALIAIDPETAEATVLPAPSDDAGSNHGVPRGVTGLGWTGRTAVFRLGGFEDFDYLAYDVDSERWSSLPPVPTPDYEGTVCVVGSSVYVLYVAGGGTDPVWTWKLDAEGKRWRPQPDGHLPPGADAAEEQCDNGQMVVTVGSATATTPGPLWFDGEAEEWLSLPDVPASMVGARPLQAGDTRVFWPDEGPTFFALAPGASVWTTGAKVFDRAYDVQPISDQILASEAIANPAEPLLAFLTTGPRRR